jgi:hypothetical protein
MFIFRYAEAYPDVKEKIDMAGSVWLSTCPRLGEV